MVFKTVVLNKSTKNVARTTVRYLNTILLFEYFLVKTISCNVLKQRQNKVLTLKSEKNFSACSNI